jgi:hypothetical protein
LAFQFPACVASLFAETSGSVGSFRTLPGRTSFVFNDIHCFVFPRYRQSFLRRYDLTIQPFIFKQLTTNYGRILRAPFRPVSTPSSNQPSTPK